MNPFLARLVLGAVGVAFVLTTVLQFAMFFLHKPHASNALHDKIDALHLAAPPEFNQNYNAKIAYIRSKAHGIIAQAFERMLAANPEKNLKPFVDMICQKRYIAIYEIPLDDCEVELSEIELDKLAYEKLAEFKRSPTEKIGIKLGIICANNLQHADKIMKTLVPSTPEASPDGDWFRIIYDADIVEFLDGDKEMYDELFSQTQKWIGKNGKNNTLYTAKLVTYKDRNYVLYPEKCYDMRYDSEHARAHLRTLCRREARINVARQKAKLLAQEIMDGTTKAQPRIDTISILDSKRYNTNFILTAFGTPKGEFCYIDGGQSSLLLVAIKDIKIDNSQRNTIEQQVKRQITANIMKELTNQAARS